MIWRFLFSILLLSIVVKSDDLLSPLDWTDPITGTKFDFSSLKKNPE